MTEDLPSEYDLIVLGTGKWMKITLKVKNRKK